MYRTSLAYVFKFVCKSESIGIHVRVHAHVRMRVRPRVRGGVFVGGWTLLFYILQNYR